MKVCITGASGYLGRALVERLADAVVEIRPGVVEAVELRCVSRRPPLDPAPGVEWIEADVLDPGSLAGVFDGIDVLVHAAGMVSHDPADAEALFEVHVLGTRHALTAARDAGVRRCVYLSSSGTIAVQEKLGDATKVKPLDEGAPRPLEVVKELPYYRSKLFAEDVALELNTGQFAVVCLNPSLLLGPGDDMLGKSTQSVRMFFEGNVPPPPPGGIAFVDVRDVAAAVEDALVKGEGGRRYLLNGANWTFDRYLRTLGRMTDVEVPAMKLPGATRKMLGWLPKLSFDDLPVKVPVSRDELILSCLTWYCDDKRARTELGFASRDPLETLYDTVRDIQQREKRYPGWA